MGYSNVDDKTHWLFFSVINTGHDSLFDTMNENPKTSQIVLSGGSTCLTPSHTPLTSPTLSSTPKRTPSRLCDCAQMFSICCLRVPRERRRQSTQISHQNGSAVVEQILSSTPNTNSHCSKEPGPSTVVTATISEVNSTDSNLRWVRITVS